MPMEPQVCGVGGGIANLSASCRWDEARGSRRDPFVSRGNSPVSVGYFGSREQELGACRVARPWLGPTA